VITFREERREKLKIDLVGLVSFHFFFDVKIYLGKAATFQE